MEGLCIDDYFVVAIEKRGQPCPDGDDLSHRAQACYFVEELQGSPAKDLVSARQGTLVGAEVVSGHG